MQWFMDPSCFCGVKIDELTLIKEFEQNQTSYHSKRTLTAAAGT
jgi:hypothetical protein